MKHNLKLKGRLRSYLNSPMYLTALLFCLNIPIYFDSIRAGTIVTGFLVIYFLCVFTSYMRNRPILMKELISFATQYATVQKSLLDDFEVPYALLDRNGKILWINKKFSEITGKNKEYHKSVFSIFHTITKEQLASEEEVIHVRIEWKERIFRAEMNRIYFDIMTDD